MMLIPVAFVKDIVPDYGGGPAPEFHGIPY